MNMQRCTSLIPVALLAFLAYAPATYAQGSINQSINVTAKVDPSCELTVTDLAFPDYFDGAALPDDGQTSIEVKCVNALGYNVGLDDGKHASGGGSFRRQMEISTLGSFLHYGLFMNSARSTFWGNTIGVDTKSGTGNGSFQPYNIYGRIPIGQPVPAGDYKDVVTVTVSW